MTSLSDITGVDEGVLQRKFGLSKPLYQFDRNERENCVFMSHTILLNDAELKHGGDLEMSPSKVLGLVTKDILESKDPSLFQVPEITCLHMGYGKNSENKEGRMAISEKDAKNWLDVLMLPFTQLQTYDQMQAAEETVDFPFDETVYPRDSGLQIPQKGSLILLFSILLHHSKKKGPRKKSNSPNKKGIGANKISDFLSFWILPYLLNFTQRKVEEIMRHHGANGNDPSRVKTVKKSAWDIISQATQSKPDHLSKLKEKLDLYFNDKLDDEYTLLQCHGSPVVLVPLSCVYKEKDDPLRLDDIGNKWTSREGKILSNEEFFDAFIKTKEIQKDYFKCMEIAKLRVGVDYAIVFPDPEAFKLFFHNIRSTCPVLTDRIQKVGSQGKGMKSPLTYHGVVKCSGQNVIVCFTYFQGKDASSVSALFRAIGATYLNHFSIVFLHGSNFEKDDSNCKLGSLYHVREAKCMTFKKRRIQKDAKKKSLPFDNGISKFVDIKFPKSFQLFVRNVCEDEDVEKAKADFDIKPEKFEPSQHLKVAFASKLRKVSLKKALLYKKKGIKESNLKELSRQDIKAANLDGILFSMLYKHGRKDKIGVTLAINNTLGNEDPLPVLKRALDKVIYYFVVAIINAGLRDVFPPAHDEEELSSNGGRSTACNVLARSDASMLARRDPEDDKDDSNTKDKDVSRPTPSKRRRVNSSGCEIGSDDDEEEEEEEEEDSDKDDDDEDDEDDEEGKDEDSEDSSREGEEEGERQKSSYNQAGASVTRPREEAFQIDFKEGKPSDPELDELAGEIGQKWDKLGIHLGISNNVLEEIATNAKDKPYAMLLRWRDTTSSAAPYRELYYAMCHERVGLNNLAGQFCCKTIT